MKRRTWKVQKSKRWWGAGAVLLVSFTASAGFSPVCDNCQLPSPSPVTALGLDAQIPGLAAAEISGLGKPFDIGSSALAFPELLKLSGVATPSATPSWTDRVASGYLPPDFSLLPRPLADPNSFTWNGGSTTAEPGVFNPFLAMSSLWQGPSAPWAQAAQFSSGMGLLPIPQSVLPAALPRVAIAAGTAR